MNLDKILDKNLKDDFTKFKRIIVSNNETLSKESLRSITSPRKILFHRLNINLDDPQEEEEEEASETKKGTGLSTGVTGF